MSKKVSKLTNEGNNANLLLAAADVRWLPRYSETMADDNMGRWARVAYAGKFNNIGFYRGKVCRWEIAWISKIKLDNEVKYLVQYKYPSNGKAVHTYLKDAQKEVEKTFQWFVKMCAGKISCS